MERETYAVTRAEEAINGIKDLQEREWFIKLLDILKKNSFATVHGKNGRLLDVTHIANTNTWASFFDIFNIINLIDIKIEPEEIKEETPSLNRSYYKFFRE